MKLPFIMKIVAYSFLALSSDFVLAATLPPGLPPGLYDEANVPSFTLPDPLVMLNGDKVKDINTWKQKRRSEILELFEENVYGKTMIGRPKDMTWKVISENRSDMNGAAITKRVTIYFAGKDDGPKMDVNFILPARGELVESASAAQKPVPIFLVPGWIFKPQTLLNRGYGMATFNPNQVEPDNKDGYPKSIRKFFAKPDQNVPGPNEWGTLGAWAWAMSRAMDYIVTDKDIDANKVCVMGVSRYGKTAVWAGAQDQRFAITYSCVSGCGGIVIVRRGFGETVKGINGMFPHWFCRNFKKFGSHVNDLPVDWHMLVALMAPRPVYISTAEQDLWTDPRGSFLSGKYAEPVYQLFGEKGLGVDDMPPVETPVGDFIGFHMRKGAHGITDYDWQQFLNFADRHFEQNK